MNLAGVDTNLLVPLAALLRERSVVRAARAVGRSQPAMSHALARLRELFGDPLLVQVGREQRLTPRARSLVAPVTEAVARLEQLFTPPEPWVAARSRRTFRIAATDNLELYLLQRLAPLLLAEAPAVTLQFLHLPADWQERLQAGALDLKLGRHYPLPARFHAAPLFEEKLVCVVRSGHPALRRGLDLAAYLALPHLQVVPREGEAEPSAVDRALARRGERRRVALTVSHFLAAPFALTGSDLVLTCSERVARTFAAPLGLQLLPAPLPLARYRLTAVWAAQHQHDPANQWLRALLLRAAQEDAPPRRAARKTSTP